MPNPRILILNCYSDNHRSARGTPWIMPQSIAPAMLAGMLDPARVDIRLACEFRSGPFEDLGALQWAELLVLTGLNPAFDRMKQVTAYAQNGQSGHCRRHGWSLGANAAEAQPPLFRLRLQ
jgi:hypothetical protein